MSAIEKQLVDSSRMIADMVAARIGNNQNDFDEAVDLMNRNEHPLSMRVARVIYLVFKKNQHIIRKHIPSFVKTLKNTKVDGVKRSLLSILTETTLFISEEALGELIDIGFNFLSHPQEPMAVKAISIDLIMKTTKTYPELKQELQSILESIYPECSVGLKGKITKTLKKL